MKNPTTHLLLIVAVCFSAFSGAPMSDHYLIASPPSTSVPTPIPDPLSDSVLEPTPAPNIPLEVRVSPVTYLAADAAEVMANGDDAVVIFVEGLKPGRKYGAILAVSNQPVEFIEVHPAKNPFPPSVQKPFRENAFLIAGNPGDVFYVSVRAFGEPPTWFTVTIEGDGSIDPPPPPPIDGEIQKLSKARADALNDPPTRSSLKSGINTSVGKIEADCSAGNCPELTAATKTLVDAIEGVMGLRTGDSRFVEWKTAWRTPVSEAIKAQSPTSTTAYLSLMKEAALGL